MSTTLFVACRAYEVAFAIAGDIGLAADGRVLAHPIRIEDALCLARAADVLMIDPTGLDGAQLSAIADRTKLVLIRDSYTSAELILSMTLGASGCVLATSSASLLADAAMTVHAGYAWFTGCVAPARERCAAGLHGEPRGTPAPELTPREREIVSLVGDGLTNKQIARRLDISDKTVQTQLHRVYVKLRQSGRYKAFNSIAASGPLRLAANTAAGAPSRSGAPRRGCETTCAGGERSRECPSRVRA